MGAPASAEIKTKEGTEAWADSWASVMAIPLVSLFSAMLQSPSAKVQCLHGSAARMHTYHYPDSSTHT